MAYVSDINYILSWKSRRLNNIKIKSIKTNNYLLNPRMDHYDMRKIRIKFDESFLNRFPPTILHGDIVIFTFFMKLPVTIMEAIILH